MKKRPCYLDACGEPATRDTPVCVDHWRMVPLELRREFMDVAGRVVRAAEEEEARCPELAVVNPNAGAASCYLFAGHEGKCRPHPSFYDHV